MKSKLETPEQILKSKDEKDVDKVKELEKKLQDVKKISKELETNIFEESGNARWERVRSNLKKIQSL
jgi:hypothetical protein